MFLCFFICKLMFLTSMFCATPLVPYCHIGQIFLSNLYGIVRVLCCAVVTSTQRPQRWSALKCFAACFTTWTTTWSGSTGSAASSSTASRSGLPGSRSYCSPCPGSRSFSCPASARGRRRWVNARLWRTSQFTSDACDIMLQCLTWHYHKTK